MSPISACHSALEQGDRLVAHHVENAVGDEPRDLLLKHHRLLAEAVHERHRCGLCLVAGRRPAHDLHAAHDQRRVEEVQVHDPVGAPSGSGQLRGHQARGVAGQDRVRWAEPVEIGEERPLHVELLDRALGELFESGARAAQGVGAEVDERDAAAGEHADHADVRAHSAGPDDRDGLYVGHGHRPRNCAGRFSRKAFVPSTLSSVW